VSREATNTQTENQQRKRENSWERALKIALNQSLTHPLLLIPSFSLNPRVVKDLINSVLSEALKGKEYDQNETGTWTKDIATQIKGKLKELKLPRYKFLVQVIIGEMKGAGVRSVNEEDAQITI
jgi:Ribonuclease G/E